VALAFGPVQAVVELERLVVMQQLMLVQETAAVAKVMLSADQTI